MLLGKHRKERTKSMPDDLSRYMYSHLSCNVNRWLKNIGGMIYDEMVYSVIEQQLAQIVFWI